MSCESIKSQLSHFFEKRPQRPVSPKKPERKIVYHTTRGGIPFTLKEVKGHNNVLTLQGFVNGFEVKLGDSPETISKLVGFAPLTVFEATPPSTTWNDKQDTANGRRAQ